jgi:HAD superfamily hydrolase (TIGR01549 family)
LTNIPIEVDVLKDLDVTQYLDPILISETEGIEKPSSEIFLRACIRAGVRPDEVLHVGDELETQVHYCNVMVVC